MARRNISLPDDLDEQARRARLNVSALAQRAVAAELDRRERMARLDAWLDELDAVHGQPSARAMAEARKWVASRRQVRRPQTSATRKRAAPRAAG
jgi:post-segregation antitoxin (ccd killing protein)